MAVQENPLRIVSPVVDNLRDDLIVEPVKKCGDFECSQTINIFMKNSMTPINGFTSPTQLIPILTVLGGFFAMSRRRFIELGMFDKKLKLWGAENIEISIKNWCCGGEVVVNPCSRVGF